ncbi:protein phosphatase 2C-like protein 1 [Staphylotrichum tortipilum]|uniref:Protein phosphatase 2C-like protein 1 n=1 Tax=Staphylotrichum tortipilum TaxID=2831512 RepID=A0AAN6RVG4_9PEZI|nr:protein phosphatase 2C-like protein 1 [Staphylotrichum longicolle]
MNVLEWAFGKRITPAERLRKNQRLLDKAIRELDQQRVKLEKQEKTLIAQIRQSAQKGQMGACKVQAKDLVRTRRYVEKFYGMRSQLQKVSLRLQTYRTNEQMMQAMKGATMALGSMNRTMNLPSLQRIAMEFERENDIMEQRQEMMDDAIDDAMDVGLEEEGDEVVEQVLEEIGVDLSQALGETPSGLQSNTVAETKIAQAVGGGGGGGELPTTCFPTTYRRYTPLTPTVVSVGPRHQVPTQPASTQPPAALDPDSPATRFTQPTRLAAPAPAPISLPLLTLDLFPLRRSLSAQGGLLNRMFGSETTTAPDAGVSAPKDKAGSKSPSPEKDAGAAGRSSPAPTKTSDPAAPGENHGEKRSGNGGSTDQKKRRSSGVSGKASSLIAQAKTTLFTQVGSRANSDLGADSKSSNQTPLQKLGKQDQALAVPQGQHNNAAGESLPGPRSTFKVGVWEDRNKKCRRTMEDTHAFLYNFLHTPAPALGGESGAPAAAAQDKGALADPAETQGGDLLEQGMMETDNGYFAVFDGHAGTFAADWCGKKLHIILEDIIRKNPNAPIPELLDQTFTAVDAQLVELPLKNSGCTAAVAVLRWEDRVPSTLSATGSQSIAPALAKAAEEVSKSEEPSALGAPEAAHARIKSSATRQRVLYTANVGDARIILCRQGKALRLSYDHKGSDENEGNRITKAGGLMLNNRVNGVLAVTRALGDAYMKELVTGHPYTTETVIQPDLDEFVIIACDGLWDVCSDQDAVDLVRNVQDPTTAAKLLVDHALARFSTDNLSCMIVRFDKQALLENQTNKDKAIGVEGDAATAAGKVSEAEKIVSATKAKIADGASSPVGVSASNSGKGHEPALPAGAEEGADKEKGFTPTVLEGPVEEEPAAMEDAPAVAVAEPEAEEPRKDEVS